MGGWAKAAVASLLLVAGLLAGGCAGPEREGTDGGTAAAERPSVLLVTLDTTRADAVEPEAEGVETPALAALAARGVRFIQGYTTAPQTLPAHASMLTGLYPAGHGVHENGRPLPGGTALLAERLQEAGYATAAFVSAFPLERQFGLARGFGHYDDDFGSGLAERPAGETTGRALAWLGQRQDSRPLFLWVHYYDPHEPYQPPEPYRSRHAERPYLGEIAYMDRELGRLLAGFEARYGDGSWRVIVAGDHGEGLGEHGEAFHGNLLYQGVMRVPLVIAGSGIDAGERTGPVSVRRIFGTVLAWAGLDGGPGLLDGEPETVLAEAMKPYLQYGWQPQVMAVAGRWKAIRSGGVEVYDVAADPAEAHDLAGEVSLDPRLGRALADYPVPAADDAPAPPLSEEDRQKLASLGYVASPEGRPALRPDAPSPRRMAHLFADLDRGSGLFVRGEYRAAIPVFERVLAADPGNFTAALRLAVAHSALGQDREALEHFRRAAGLDPDSLDLAHYRAMHHFRAGEWGEAAPLLEAVLARQPERLPALKALARIREHQGRPDEAAALLERAAALEKTPAPTLIRLGALRMAAADTAGAIRAFEQARALAGDEAFGHFLELGVLYLAARRLPEARDALDRIPPSHPAWPMALFKRAQVSVLLGEPDRAERIRRARAHADATTRELIENEALFRGVEERSG